VTAPRVDPVEVAKRWLSYPSEHEYWVIARVVLAAVERVKHGHNDSCLADYDAYSKDPGCDCGHDALVAALEGGR